MNQFAPDWSRNMGDAFAPLGGEDDGLMELLWCNGHVVMQSQAPPRKSPRPERAAAAVQDDEAAAWFQYPVVEDPLERDLFSVFFGETAAGAGTVCKQEEGYGVAAPQSGGLMMPPRPAHAPPREKAISGDTGTSEGAVANSAGGEGGAAAATETGDSSALTVGSSFCGSNHVQMPLAGVPVDAAPPPWNGGKARDAATVTSSSSLRPMSSDTKTEAPGAGAHRSAGKRKQRDDDSTQCDVTSQDAESESAAVKCEPVQKPTTGKRRRAAEVHNLSERRRRDRINEKMKVLQELVPHCNKTDKASMLDEAIEYLKSLQLQLQMMWMGGAGMAAPAAPVMFPAGAHQYMQRLASMPMMPFMPAPLQSPAVGHQMPAADPYRCYPAADHLHPPSPMHYMQGMMSLYQQQQSPAPPPVSPGGSVPAATAPTPPSDGFLHKKYETCDEPDIRGMKS